MNAKNVTLFLIVILLIVGSLYFIQNKNQDKELVAHNMQRFKQITETAKGSSRAGLLEMASAINKFHRTKGHYPKRLMDLYPEFIPDKPFISTLKWKYSPENGSYILQKNVGGKQNFASIGPNLKLKTGNHKNQIVSVSKAPQNKQSLKKINIPKHPEIKPDLNDKVTLNELKKKVSLKGINPSGNLKIDTKKKVSKPQQSLIVKKELGKDEKFLLSFDDNRFYIWKGKDGFIGFSDTQYPVEKELSIYRDNGWVQYN